MKFLNVSKENSVTLVALNRPEKRNAFHAGMIKELTQSFAAIAKDRHARAVLLTGEGASFCAGGDLEWMKSMAKFTMKQNLADAKALFKMFWTIRNCPVPVIAHVHGHCFGGGAGLTAVCDIVCAEAKTQFSFSEVKWGLVPAVISPFVHERASPSAVREWFLTGKVFKADEALRAGLINHCGDERACEEFLNQTFANLNAAGPEATRATKKLHQSLVPTSRSWKTLETQVTKLIAQRRVSKEGQHGLAAFINKRNPGWLIDGEAL